MVYLHEVMKNGHLLARRVEMAQNDTRHLNGIIRQCIHIQCGSTLPSGQFNAHSSCNTYLMLAGLHIGGGTSRVGRLWRHRRDFLLLRTLCNRSRWFGHGCIWLLELAHAFRLHGLVLALDHFLEFLLVHCRLAMLQNKEYQISNLTYIPGQHIFGQLTFFNSS